MSEVKLAATARTEFGKGAARRLRRAHQIPAVLYGHGAEPVHVALPGHETMLALKQQNVLLALDLDGTKHLAIAKDVQRDPVKQVIEHVDLLAVRKGEKITVDVAVHVVGESAPGTIHLTETQNISVEAEATHLPEFVEVSIEGLEAGAAIRGEDLVLPSGSTFLGNPDDVIVTISVPQMEEEPEAAEGEAAEGAEGEAAEGAEGESAEASDGEGTTES